MNTSRRSFLIHSLNAGALAAAWPMMPANAAASASQARRALTIDAPSGPVRGAVEEGIRIFKGIPYAQAPVGELRFAPPQPLAPTSTVRNAFSFGPAPVQPDRPLPSGRLFLGDAKKSEDCLQLNVWAPDTPGPHPVFVWIYGGSNMFGASSQIIYDGSSFARSGVVCVSIGYRVGAFGFMELGDVLGESYRGSGNNALRDQVLGLQWVRDNIAAFGGDPARVTLAGESAGGKNVAGLLAAPAAAGLFSQAIMQSGGGMTAHSREEAGKVTQLVLDALSEGRPGADARSLLLGTSTAGVLKAQLDAVAKYPRNFAFRSVVDGSFLPHSPQELVAAGASSKVPLLIGSNRDESAVFFPPALMDAGRKDPNTDAPIALRELAQLDLATMTRATQRYREAFPQQPAFERRIRLLTAEEYWMPTVRMAEAHAAAGGQTYMYRFDEKAKQGRFEGYTVHASELAYTWRNFNEPFLEQLYGKSPPVPPLADVIHATWVSFIRDGKPHHRALPVWPQYEAGQRKTMLLAGSGGTVANDPAGDQRVLWDGLL